MTRNLIDHRRGTEPPLSLYTVVNDKLFLPQWIRHRQCEKEALEQFHRRLEQR